MKVYLASYLEPDYHGPGKKYAITLTKPDNFEVAGAFTFFIPSIIISETYCEKQLEDQQEAANYFNKAFKEQLDEFYEKVKASAEENQPLTELLPFEDGDTLLSYERFGFTSYRPLVAECLEKLGYEVELK